MVGGSGSARHAGPGRGGLLRLCLLQPLATKNQEVTEKTV